MNRALLLVGSAVSIVLGPAEAAPITTETALPVAAKEFIARSQLIYAEASSRAIGARTLIWENALGYGLQADWAVFAVVPLAFGRIEPILQPSDELTGFGDIRIFARYTALKRNGPGYTFRITPFAGVELPSGRSGIGSRSTDPFAGVVATFLNNDVEVDVSARYQVNTPKFEVNLGDLLNIDGSVQYRLLPRRLGTGVPRFLYAVGEVNYVRVTAGDAIGDARADLFLSPGIQLVSAKYILEGGVQIPVRGDGRAGAPRPDFALRLGFREPF
jgi:hypothetical protein